MISNSEMMPYLNFASAILKRAYKDIVKNNIYAKDACKFLESEWGESLRDNISEIEKMMNDDEVKQKNSNKTIIILDKI